MPQDWFADLVEQACADVLANDDVRANLALADQLTPESVRAEITNSAETIEELRVQFAQTLAQVEQIESRKGGMARSRNSANLQAKVDEATDRLIKAQAVSGTPASRDFPKYGSAHTAAKAHEGRQSTLAAAENALRHAQDEYQATQEPPDVQELNAARKRLEADLRRQLTEPLTLRVNTVIDAALATSYRREFSYAGIIRLGHLPSTDAGQVSDLVNHEAIRTVQSMIDSGLTGAVGIAGPRGIGKSTLLARFTGGDHGRFRGPWRICVAAPAQYDPRDFLLHLFGQLCIAVLDDSEIRRLEDKMTGQGIDKPPFPVRWLLTCIGIIVAGCAAVITGLKTARPLASPGAMTDLLIAGSCLVIAAAGTLIPDSPLRGWLTHGMFCRIAGKDGLTSAYEPSSAEKRWFYARIHTVKQIRIYICSASAGAAIILICCIVVGTPPLSGYLTTAILSAGAIGASLLARIRFTGYFFPYDDEVDWETDEQRLRHVAGKWYQRVKFQQSYTTGWSGTVTLAPKGLPVQAQVGRSGSREIAPLSMSIPEIVTAFNSFVDELCEPLRERSSDVPTEVIIGIDEVDKIEDPKEAQALFNQIKGLFSNTRCLFLISISDDAMASYERRGLPLRDALDSSLSSVISLPYLSRREARILIGSYLVGVTSPSADLLYILSGGLPRELVRLIRISVDLQERYTNYTSQEAWSPVPIIPFATGLIADQVSAQRRAILIRGRSLEPCPARDSLLSWAADQTSESEIAWISDVKSVTPSDYFNELRDFGTQLMNQCSTADVGTGLASLHSDGCVAEETGAFLLWLATVGEILASCKKQADFEEGEKPDSSRSFERLARVRQNFALGPGYVRTTLTKIRDEWGLEKLPPTPAG